MTAGLMFWAQALDNSSPDHIHVGVEVVSPDDAPRRQKIVSLISSADRRGTRNVLGGQVRIALGRSHFVLEVPSMEDDAAGRKAPILCCGETSALAGSVAGEWLAIELAQFAARIGRNIDPGDLKLIRELAPWPTKKKTDQERNRLIRRVVMTCLLAVLAYWIVAKLK